VSIEQKMRNLGIPEGLSPEEVASRLRDIRKVLDQRLEEAKAEHQRAVDAQKAEPLSEKQRYEQILSRMRSRKL
jgi:C4-dicarboxylate-specific signal transduction histidine kinase